MIILTGNDLASGDVLWWAGDTRWSHHLHDAVDAGEAAAAILATEEAARRINGSYAVEADASPHGLLPRHIKDRVRAAGPTVRTDLAIDPSIPIVKG